MFLILLLIQGDSKTIKHKAGFLFCKGQKASYIRHKFWTQQWDYKIGKISIITSEEKFYSNVMKKVE